MKTHEKIRGAFKKTPPVLCKFALFQLQFKLLDLSPIITVATRRRVTLGVGPKNSSHLECSRFSGSEMPPTLAESASAL